MVILRLGVLGAGIVGLTTALELQEAFPSAQVTVVADKFNADTTSDGAAGLFRPANNFMGPNLETTTQWLRDSYKWYSDLMKENCGVFEVSGFILSSTSEKDVSNPLIEGIVPVCRACTPEELLAFPGNWKFGTYMTTLIVKGRHFLPWALARIKQNGGRVLARRVHEFSELEGKFDVVVNCSGLGAQQLCNDNQMVPMRGQLVKVRAPNVKNFYFADWNTYIIPFGDGIVTLGGTYEYNNSNTQLVPHDARGIRQRCEALLPQLKGAPVAWQWVGLRPHRPTVRVEAESIGKLKVVHNYGHGAYGVTSAPGTAKHAVQLVQKMVGGCSKL